MNQESPTPYSYPVHGIIVYVRRPRGSVPASYNICFRELFNEVIPALGQGVGIELDNEVRVVGSSIQRKDVMDSHSSLSAGLCHVQRGSISLQDIPEDIKKHETDRTQSTGTPQKVRLVVC